jgi:hypothetical protein
VSTLTASGGARRVSLGRKLRTIAWLVAMVPVCVAMTFVTVLSLAITLPLVLYSAFKQHREKNPWRRSTPSDIPAIDKNSAKYSGSSSSR